MVAVREMQLKEAWRQFIDSGVVIENQVRPVILESWKRCRENNVNPLQTTVKEILSKSRFQKVLQENEELISLSSSYMNTLYEFVKDSGFIILLADANGIILKIIGDEVINQKLKSGGFIEGADWSENSAGTNAIGTALVTKKPEQIFSYEHFCRGAQMCTCSCAPIRNVDYKIIGGINLSAYDNNVNSHTLGMAVAAANAIENALKMVEAQEACRISNTYKSTIIDSISQGVLAVDKDGKVTHLNSIASSLLGIRLGYAGRQAEDSIFRLLPEDNRPLFAILQDRQYVTDKEITINTTKGSNKFNITCRPIQSDSDGFNGIVLIIDEIKRVRKIIGKMSGAFASFTFQDMIGKNKRYLDTIETAKHAARSDSTVLLLGESGTGKDIFAQAIHNYSNRRNGPFVAINCAAIPRELIGSELFGYVEGAFTGARRGGSLGKFELADGGTIFLDEIGDMPLDMQANLLRVIEEKRITRIGGQEITPIDLRFIVATNRDLFAEVEKGRFRNDLYYRLNVITINLIPLRERMNDIPEFVNSFYEQQIVNLRKTKHPIPQEYIDILSNYSFPGNIRELQNIIERSVNLSGDGRLDVSYLPYEILNSKLPDQIEDVSMTFEAFEKKKISDLLQKNSGNISKVSYDLGIARSTLYRKLNKYGFTKDIKLR